MITPTDEKIKEFLKESNAIEHEYSDIALNDANQAWITGVLNAKDDFSVELILGIHRRILKRLAPQYAGKIRTFPIWIGGEKRDQSKEEIILQLNELVDMWNKNKDILKSKNKRKQDREEFVKRWHILFELCHMAGDGNGRTGRILMNLQRLMLGLPILIIHTGIEQQNYYQWFRGKRTHLWEYQKQKIIKDYDNGKGKSVGQIADGMNLNHQLVSNLLKRNGIKVLVQWNNPPKGERNGHWKGGIRHIKGYRHFYDPKHNLARKDGWVPEHRAIMQKHLRKNLLPEEVVHHKDKDDIENNNINNLKLFKNNGEHRKEHLKNQKRDLLGKFK
jgi:fido (protein-threonine AMPylation protein)